MLNLLKSRKGISSPNVKHVCPLFMCSELRMKTAHEHLSTEFLNVH